MKKIWRLTKLKPTPHGESAKVTKLFTIPEGYKISSVSACWTSILLVIKAAALLASAGWRYAWRPS